MKTLLLAGYQNSEQQNTGLIEFNGQLWIDWQIEQLTKIGHEVTIVLGDRHSEDLLSKSELLSKCDLVFDTNGEDTTLITNLRSGLHSVIRHCNTLPITTPVPDVRTWRKLNDHYFRLNAEKYDLLKSFCPKNGVMHDGFPIIITRTGAKKIKSNKGIMALDDKCLTYSPVPHLETEITNYFPEVT